MRWLVAILAVLVLAPPVEARRWLAGDLHVHTCHSHDVYCASEPKEPEEIYTYGFDVAQRFDQAFAVGLDYLAITDHADVRSSTNPGFGAHGVIGVPGYENSIKGHAQMLGARRLLDKGDSSAGAINRMADELRAEGGVFQANHPADDRAASLTGCDNPGGQHWTYGYAVQPDTIEVWNLSSWVIDAERYLDCWLDRGARIGLTGGSDSHWATTAAAQGVGNPTTWVLAKPTTQGVLDGLDAGRTSLSRLPPNEGGAPLRMQVKRKDGWHQAIGKTVRPGATMRVKAAAPGFITVRANRENLVTDAYGVGTTFTAPEQGWVRATLHSLGGTAAQLPNCRHETESPFPISGCPYDLTMLGMTSPAYVR